MYCTSCGRPVASGNQFCPACGTPVAAGPQVSTRAPNTVPGDVRITRPTGVSVIAVLDFIGVGFLLIAALVAIGGGAFASDSSAGAVIAGVFLTALGALYLVAGLGLWKLKSYGRTMQIVMAIIGLLGFPLGTIVSIAILVYLFKPGVKILFSGRPVGELTAEEAFAVKAVTSGRSSTAVMIVVIIGIVVAGVVVVGIVAAIAIPGLLRARMTGNEAAAIARIRSLNSAQAVYSSQSGGAYGTLDCLAAPATCLSGYAGPALINKSDVEQAVTAGYRFTFYSMRSSGAAAKPTDLAGYVIVAVPVTPGSTGQRGFCGDASGAVCFTPDGRAPTSEGGKCGACQPIQ